jgi:uncharacterized protein YbcI
MKSSLARLGGSLKSKPMWRNTRGVFCHVGFFMHVFDGVKLSRSVRRLGGPHEGTKMNNTKTHIAQQLAHVASVLQQQRTGLAPKAVTAVLSEDTLVVTLHDALTPAEKALSQTPEGAAQVQEFHRQLFSSSSEFMRKEIKRITGREVREATAEVETATGTVVHAFTTGSMVQLFLLTPEVLAGTDRDSIERADDDGFRPAPELDTSR